MLYYLYHWQDVFSPLRMLQYVTVRAFAGAGTAFILSLLLGPPMIRMLRRLKYGQQVRGQAADAIAELHDRKQGTPTMGGLLIMVSVLISSLLWAVPTNGFVLMALATMCVMGGIGFLDDWLKIKRKQSEGLSPKQKLALQFAWLCVAMVFLMNYAPTREHVRHFMVPFVKDPVIQNMGLLGTLIFLFLVMVGSTNAVNLTDGLDGLAVGCTSSVAFAYLVMAYVAGHAVFSDYLLVPFVPGSHELAVFCGCLLGASLGFLWYNCHPAQVFMGDTGSLALGGSLAMVAILIKQELVLVIVGGVFVMEALSVLLQVGYFKLSGGKRIFRCAPIHHHFEILEKEKAQREGRDIHSVEVTVTIRLWIISIVFALIGLATLKIR